MKRIVILLLLCLLLCGCTDRNQTPETTIPATFIPETVVTEPPVPWVRQLGTNWDRDGVLLEVPMNIPNGPHYTNALEFQGDLLLWSIDNHLQDVYTLELCLLDLDSGEVITERELDFTEYVMPQILGENVYLCDQLDGLILTLDSQLEICGQWDVEGSEGNFVMGGNEILYCYDWNGNVTRKDLKTGQSEPLLPEVYIDYFTVRDDCVSIQYSDPDTGAPNYVLMDLHTGEFLEPPRRGNYSDVFYAEGAWLCESFRDGYTAYVGTSEADFLRADLGFHNLMLLDGNTLFLTSEDGCGLSLHDLSGKSLVKVVLTEQPYSYTCSTVISSEAFGGYFLLLNDYSGSLRLLYWDTSFVGPGEDILFEPIPEPGEMEAAVRSRAEELSRYYGVNILVGSDCGTEFFDFSGEQVTDWEAVNDALDYLENALASYPEGFFRQLRYGEVRRTDIHLVGTLTATTAEYTDTYEAFVQENYDCHTLVADINLTDEGTYYHEFSHIIDSYLEWDAMNRENALFSDAAWCDLNPGWFPGYTYDYSWEQYVEDYSSFVDSYSTINPTEDRARVLEYAMADYGTWTFEGSKVLLRKLDYYCRCIRDAFDTTGWPENLLWEQYLP